MALPKIHVNISMSITGSTMAMSPDSTSRTEWMKLRVMNVDSAVNAPMRGRTRVVVVMVVTSLPGVRATRVPRCGR